MSQMEEDSYDSTDYQRENTKWQKSVVRERIKNDLKNNPELLDEIVSEIRREKIQKITSEKRKI